MKLIYHVSFLCETHENLLALWNTGQYFITLLAGLFSAKITNKKHKNMKNLALSGSQKEQLFTA